jgi:hypothetical protein
MGQILLCITVAGMPLNNGHLIFQCFCGYLSPLSTGLFSSLVITSHIVAILCYIVNLFPDGQFMQGQ